mmetsp:Transcript_23911/g.68411  ORF Transcript_23911/g.68411 Transcript_23911/m.68411 type:complete len:319 (+) Transcript_23911:278-1234(+)
MSPHVQGVDLRIHGPRHRRQANAEESQVHDDAGHNAGLAWCALREDTACCEEAGHDSKERGQQQRPPAQSVHEEPTAEDAGNLRRGKQDGGGDVMLGLRGEAGLRLCAFPRLLQHGGTVVHDGVDAGPLLQGLQAAAQQQRPPDARILEAARPEAALAAARVSERRLLVRACERVPELPLHVGRAHNHAPQHACHRPRLLRPALGEQPARRLRHPEDAEAHQDGGHGPRAEDPTPASRDLPGEEGRGDDGGADLAHRHHHVVQEAEGAPQLGGGALRNVEGDGVAEDAHANSHHKAGKEHCLGAAGHRHEHGAHSEDQ